MDAAWIGLIGVALGGGLSFAGEEFRWRRQEGVRWNDERRRAYSHLLTTADAFEQAARRFGEQTPGSGDWQLARINTDQSRAALQDCLNEVEIVSGRAVRACAGNLKLSLERVFRAQTEQCDNDERRDLEKRVQDALFAYTSAFIEFKDAARSELGVEEVKARRFLPRRRS
jgi:hypothetical protein